MTQKTLQQIFDVLEYSRINYQNGNSLTSSYQEAISHVAKNYEVTYQTIGDGCRRRLKLRSIDEFSELLRKWLEGDPKPLISTLKRQTTSRLHREIDSFFKRFPTDNNSGSKAEKEENISLEIELSKTDQRYLKAICQIEEKGEKEVIGEIISESIKERMKQIALNIN